MLDITQHPCFNTAAKAKFGRVHLPVAPKCNIQCNYCNRNYDCANGARPGTSTTVLQPRQALDYLKALRADHPELKVVGITGPGDPFANPQETMETLRLVRKELPDMLLCLSTNALNLRPYIEELAELEVSHVTITINGIDPKVLSEIYRWVRADKRVYRGEEGATILLQEQLECVRLLKEKGIMVKINSIAIQEINVSSLPQLAHDMAELGADVMNIVPLCPAVDTPYADFEEPCHDLMKDLRSMASNYIQPMEDCAYCCTGGAGLLGKAIEESTQMLHDFSLRAPSGNKRKNIAVASSEGLWVNQHLGKAESLYIYQETPHGYRFLEERPTPTRGSGMARWQSLVNQIDDCRSLLVSGVGSKPNAFITKTGIDVVETTALIDDALESIFNA